MKASALFVRAREDFDRKRRHLRELEAEVERQRVVATGIETPYLGQTTRRKRSTTVLDAILGRDGIDPNAPFSRFRLLSLQRQEVLFA